MYKRPLAILFALVCLTLVITACSESIAPVGETSTATIESAPRGRDADRVTGNDSDDLNNDSFRSCLDRSRPVPTGMIDLRGTPART